MPFVALDRPSKDIVLDLINVMNPKDQADPDGPRLDLTFEQVDLANPRVGEHPGKNTTLDLVALPDFEYPGEIAVHYDRLDMSRFGVGGAMQFDGYYFTTSKLLQEFNATFQLGITTLEVDFDEVDDNDTITLKIGDSFAYLPSTELRIREGFFSLVDRVDHVVRNVLFDIGTAPLPGIPEAP